MVERLEKLIAEKGQFANHAELSFFIKKNSYLRVEICELYEYFFDKKVTGCNNCICDAYLQLVTLTKERIMRKIELKYWLFAGVLLQDNGQFVTNANLTNENAQHFLRKDPTLIKKFSKYPADWAEKKRAPRKKK
jgi:hypothetical protein